MNDFAENLKRELESAPDLKRRGKKILAILNARPSRHKDRRIARMETYAEAHLKANEKSVYKPYSKGIDWGNLDWAKIIEALLKFLLAILPFILLKS